MQTRQKRVNNLFSLMREGNNSVLLLTAKMDSENKRSLLFLKPEDIIICWKIEKVERALKDIQKYLDRGLYAAGYLAYEAGFAFEENLRRFGNFRSLLMWFGIYRKPIIFDWQDLSFEMSKGVGNFQLKPRGFSVGKSKYEDAVRRIKAYIAEGFTYQVNYTIKKYFKFSGSPYYLFLQLCNNQKVPYAALIKNDYEYILSLSPELFFRINNNQITVRPMKGTIKRGEDESRDSNNALKLRESLKDRAENIMIVDLLRNDLGRVSRVGTVKTASLFDVERLSTLWQMTSTVKSKTKNNLALLEIFKNIFPSGSVTGAPKIRTMQIISELESSTRGVYTGSIGYIAPNRGAVFNVAIRTLRIDRKTNRADLGIGSGIVWDSEPEKEWQECQLKAKFVEKTEGDFQLIETLLLRKGKIGLLGYHMDRLKSSACYFDFCFKKRKILDKIKSFIKKLEPKEDYKIRLLLFKDGAIKLSARNLFQEPKSIHKIIFSGKRTNSKEPFLYHKTTRRNLYDIEHTRFRKKGYFDCIFKNERYEVTEGAITNIFIERNNKFYTPQVSCGLLNGVYRRYLLETSKLTPKECILKETDIYSADNIYLTNAISGIIKVTL